MKPSLATCPSEVRYAFAVLCGLAWAFMNVQGIQGQTNERLYEEFDFRFVTPGARAAAMGNAFVGLADDATAAYSNPAGLSNIVEPEVSLEFTATDIRHHRLITTEPEPIEEAFGDVVLTPSFFSFAVPLGRHTLSLFTNRLQDYRETFTILRRTGPTIPGFDQSAFGTTAIQVDHYGVGWSVVLTPFLSVGGSLVLATLDIASRIRNGQPLNPRNGTDTIDSARDITAIAGVLVKPFRQLSLGAVYHRGAWFDITTTLFGSFLESGMDVVRTGTERETQYVIPDRYSLGIALRPTGTLPLVLVGDLSRVRYSQLISDKFLIVDFMDSEAELTRENFFINDVTEWHVGAEYQFFLPSATLGVRIGAFGDPDHQMRFRRVNGGHVADDFLDNRFNRLAPKTDIGFSLGAGMALFNRVQFDAAGSLVRDARKLVASVVIRID